MEVDINPNKIYRKSEDIVARDVHGEFIIIPVIAGIGDLEDELFTLNNTGRDIWDRLDGRKKLREIGKDLSREFDEPLKEIEKDITGFVRELVGRRIVIEV